MGIFIIVRRDPIAGFHVHDVTKTQTTILSILLRFYFHGVLEHLKTNFQTNFRFKRVLGFVIKYAWISWASWAFAWRSIFLTAEPAVI